MHRSGIWTPEITWQLDAPAVRAKWVCLNSGIPMAWLAGLAAGMCKNDALILDALYSSCMQAMQVS